MKVIIQRVKKAHVEINSKIKSKISKGFVILIGIHKEDTKKDSEWILKKILNLRLFDDSVGKQSLNIQEINGEILFISQFTLIADCKKGTRPSYSNALNPLAAKKIYNELITYSLTQYQHIKTGEFQTHMNVSLINDGPITIILDSKNK